MVRSQAPILPVGTDIRGPARVAVMAQLWAKGSTEATLRECVRDECLSDLGGEPRAEDVSAYLDWFRAEYADDLLIVGPYWHLAPGEPR
jgi:hypothetical protein